MKKFTTLLTMAMMSLTTFAQNELVEGDFKVGDKIKVGDKEWLVGPNLITNASFDTDPYKNNNQIVGWTIGENYNQMTTTEFSWFAEGGHDNGAYIQANGHSGAAGNRSLAIKWEIDPNSRYYFSYWLAKNSANNQYLPVISLTQNESTKGGENEDEKIIGMSGNSSEGCLGFSNFKDENNDGEGEWCQTGLTFESNDNKYLQYNARWLYENKIHTCFDDFHLHKLYDPATTKAETIALISLKAAVEDFKQFIRAELSDYSSLEEESKDWLFEKNYTSLSENNTLEELQNAISDIESKSIEMKVAAGKLAEFMKQMDKVIDLFNKTSGNEYPGIDKFVQDYDVYENYVNDGYFPDDDSTPASEYIDVMLQKIKQSILDYRTSQIATPEQPADYTFFVKSPEFLNEGSEPTYNEEGLPSYPNESEYSAGSTPSDANSNGWYKGEDGGDQRLNYAQGRVCWNAWRSGANAPISISQDIENLPNGYYSVGAFMITQSGYITDQHVFAKSSVEEKGSRTLEKDTWSDNNDGEWDWLETEKVLVNDGKLTIGGIGTLNGNAAAGWFCISHFVLKYYGEASSDDLKKIYNNTIDNGKQYADAMGFNGDKNTLITTINENSNALEVEEINAALQNINAAIEEAKKSQAEFESVYSGIFAELQDNIAEIYLEKGKMIANKALEIEEAFLNGSASTYTDSKANTEILKYYKDYLLVTISNCENKEYKQAKAIECMNNNLTSVTKALTEISQFPSLEKLNEFNAQLEKAISLCDEEEFAGEEGFSDGADLTFMIKNSTINDSKATGWTINKVNGDGDGAKSGQEYDGGNGYYMDSWNPTAGTLIYTASQTIENIPNGTYELKVMTRTSSDEGLYTFAKTTNEDIEDFKFAPVKLEKFNVTKYMNKDAKGSDDNDSIDIVSDTHGSIWEEAVNKLSEHYQIYSPIAIEETPVSLAELIEEECGYEVTNVPKELQESFLIMTANETLGRGWQYSTIGDIIVTNHKLTIGLTTDSTMTAGYKDINGNDCVPFTGTWISADNWQLTLVKSSDDKEWSPTTDMSEIIAKATTRNNKRMYNLAGQLVDDSFKGITINNGKKYLVK